ncbi:MAG: hypothetical protein ABS81_05365 [Pseudonocardia sp. SCN 72-86]|mgnify:CR=1 FL=1|nr:MAG: hypothetical protein ABS81_05365 [Pseudonocardia sp. SCN 72-86]
MRVGIATIPSARGAHPGLLGPAVEERGFDRLLVSEHTHTPVEDNPRMPGGRALDPDHLHCCDPFGWVSYAAAATTRIRLGTGICLVAQHDPLVLAKQVGTIDHLSGGRFVLGIGYGYNRREAEDHGIDFGNRRAILREKVLAMRRIWSCDTAAFDGTHVRFGESWSWPKPDRPQVLMGAAAGPRTFAHVVEFCDGWMMYGAVSAAQIATLQAAAEAADRDFAELVVGVHRAPARYEDLAALAEMGVDFVTLTVEPGHIDSARADLDGLAALAAKLSSG